MIVKLFADDGTLLFAGACDDGDPSQFIVLDQQLGEPTRLRVNVTDLSALADRVGVPQPARPAQTFDTVECKWRDSPRQPR